MARSRSPGYPNFGLAEAVSRISKVFQADRRNVIERAIVAKHIGYGGLNGAADKSIATLSHYGLLDRVSKGEIRVSQLAMDILHPESPEKRKAALREAADSPQLFATLRERFPDGKFSEEALRSYLVRSGFQDAALEPAIRAYMATSQFLELERAYESDGAPTKTSEESARQDGGEGNPPPPAAPPGWPFGTPTMQPPPPQKKEIAMQGGERIMKTGMLSKGASFRLIVEGQIGVKEIERLIRQLELDKEILADQEDGGDAPGANAAPELPNTGFFG